MRAHSVIILLAATLFAIGAQPVNAADHALHFANSGQVVFPFDDIMWTDTTATVECWVKADADASGGFAPFSRWMYGQEDRTFWLAFDGSLSAYYAYSPWRIGGPGLWTPDEQWHHFSYVRDVATGSFRIFVDGNIVAEELGVTGSVFNSNAATTIGFCGDGTEDVRGWSIRELHVSDAALYTAPFTPEWDFESGPETVMLVHFDEGSGDLVHDIGPHAQVGTFDTACPSSSITWVAVDDPGSGPAPYEWIYNPDTDHYYARTPIGTTWLDAQAAARAEDAYLVSIGSAGESDWVWKAFKEHGHMWIGCSDEDWDGVWEWESGEPMTYTNWGERSPNYEYGYAPWGMMDFRTGEWSNEDDRYATSRFGILERESTPIIDCASDWAVDILLNQNPPPVTQQLLDYVDIVHFRDELYGFDGFDLGAGQGNGQNECVAASIVFDGPGSVSDARLVIELTPGGWDVATDELLFADDMTTVNGVFPGYGNALLAQTSVGVRTKITFDLSAMPGESGTAENYDLDWFVSDGQIDLLYCDDALIHSVRLQVASCGPVFAVEFSPQTLNLGSNGKWVTATLMPLWTTGVDQIDLASLAIEGVASSSATIEDDAVVAKFPRQEVGALLPVGMEVPVTLTGLLLNGTAFTATDTIRVIDPSRSSRARIKPVYPAGATASVEWRAIYGDTDTRYDGYISTDGGLIWVELFKGLRGTNTYSWKLSADLIGNAEILVEAKAPQGVFHAMTQRFTVEGVAVEAQAPEVVSEFSVKASPNPFNPRTTLFYAMPVGARAELVVYDLAGRRVKTLVSGYVDAGQHEAQWDGRDEQGRRVASGVYLYRLVAGEFSETKRMVLVK